ncbi:MAG: TNT domain-containing protein, partial [Halanaerobiales bacterium]
VPDGLTSPNIWDMPYDDALSIDDLVMMSDKQYLRKSPWPHNNGFLGNSWDDTAQKGSLIDRYGTKKGYYTSPYGTPVEKRALAPGTDLSKENYHVYRVLKSYNRESGIAAPWFGKEGLGIQHKWPLSIEELLELKILEDVTSKYEKK